MISVHRRLSTIVTAFAVIIGGVTLAAVPTVPASAATPQLVGSTALPAPQINGVVWDQVVVGNTVYAVGNFTKARPSGSPAGSNEVDRSNMLAYDLTTGVLIPGFNPGAINGEIKAVTASADGSRIYIGGLFTKVGDQDHYRVAAVNPTTGAVSSTFKPVVNNGIVTSLAATANGLFIGGNFSSVKYNTVSYARSSLAAVNPSTGAILPWSPQQTRETGDNAAPVKALVASPDGTKIVIGGGFITLNGKNGTTGVGGFGLAMVNSTTGTTNLPLEVNKWIKNAGAGSQIYALKGDADGFYGSGYDFQGDGNLEGTFMAGWNGTMVFVEDCDGDTYDIQPQGTGDSGVLYAASHKHQCARLPAGGFAESTDSNGNLVHKYMTATTKYATGSSKAQPATSTHPSHTGEPGPTMLNFFPDVTPGSFTTAMQGPWTVEGNDKYIVFGGEFTKVNGRDQQGLTRFAKKGITTSLAATGLPATSPYGASRTVTVTVTAASGTAKPAGVVTATIGSNPVATATLSNGTATLTLPRTIAVGSPSVTFGYAGSAVHEASSKKVTFTVVKAGATTDAAVATLPTPTKAGTGSIAVDSVVAGGPATTGTATVELRRAGAATKTLSTPIANGAGALTIPPLATGAWQLWAGYSGSASYNAQPLTNLGTLSIVIPKTKVVTSFGIRRKPTSKKTGTAVIRAKPPAGMPAVTGYVRASFVKKGHKTRYTKRKVLKSGGWVTVSVPKLAKGTWKVYVTYYGSSRYIPQAASRKANLKVRK